MRRQADPSARGHLAPQAVLPEQRHPDQPAVMSPLRGWNLGLEKTAEGDGFAFSYVRRTAIAGTTGHDPCVMLTVRSPESAAMALPDQDPGEIQPVLQLTASNMPVVAAPAIQGAGQRVVMAGKEFAHPAVAACPFIVTRSAQSSEPKRIGLPAILMVSPSRICVTRLSAPSRVARLANLLEKVTEKVSGSVW